MAGQPPFVDFGIVPKADSRREMEHSFTGAVGYRQWTFATQAFSSYQLADDSPRQFIAIAVKEMTTIGQRQAIKQPLVPGH